MALIVTGAVIGGVLAWIAGVGFGIGVLSGAITGLVLYGILRLLSSPFR